MSSYILRAVTADEPVDHRGDALLTRDEIRWILAGVLEDRADAAAVLKCERHLCGYIRERTRLRAKYNDQNPVREQAP